MCANSAPDSTNMARDIDWRGLDDTQVIVTLTWYLEILAEQIDEWFPGDPNPVIQNELRDVAGSLQSRFNAPSLRERLGHDVCAELDLR